MSEKFEDVETMTAEELAESYEERYSCGAMTEAEMEQA